MISWRGPSPVVIFDGVIPIYLEETVIKGSISPHIRRYFGPNHHFVQNKSPKHRAAAAFIESEGINWLKSPAESLDFNPMELVWRSLKDYVHKETDLDTKQGLVQPIGVF